MADNPPIGSQDDGVTGPPDLPDIPDQHRMPSSRASGSGSRSQRPQQDRVLQPPRQAARRPYARLQANVDTLVRKLSRQNLEQHQLQLQQQEQNNQTPIPSPSPVSSRPSPPLPTISSLEPPTNFEQTRHTGCPVNTPIGELAFLPGSEDPLNPGSPIEIDQAELLSAAPRPSFLGPDVDAMDLQYDFLPMLDPIPRIRQRDVGPAVRLGPAGMDAILEVDPACTAGGSEHGVDMVDDEVQLLEHFRAMRRAKVPGGAVRRTVSGVPLKYRLSTDVALGCQNVVRSRPRMRKRPAADSQKRSRTESFISTSSTVPSTAASAMVPPSHPAGPSPPAPPHF